MNCACGPYCCTHIQTKKTNNFSQLTTLCVCIFVHQRHSKIISILYFIYHACAFKPFKMLHHHHRRTTHLLVQRPQPGPHIIKCVRLIACIFQKSFSIAHTSSSRLRACACMPASLLYKTFFCVCIYLSWCGSFLKNAIAGHTIFLSICKRSNKNRFSCQNYCARSHAAHIGLVFLQNVRFEPGYARESTHDMMMMMMMVEVEALYNNINIMRTWFRLDEDRISTPLPLRAWVWECDLSAFKFKNVITFIEKIWCVMRYFQIKVHINKYI